MGYVGNLRVFVRIFELGSISAAGRDLRMSAAVASSRLADLEQHLGVRLFNRTTRSLKPTEHGMAFYEGARRVLEAIEAAESDVAELSGHPRGTIFVGAQFTIGRHLIAPHIPEFQARYPDVHIRLRLSDRKISVVEEGLDMAFVTDRLFDSDLRVRSIAQCRRGLFASPDFVARHGMPNTIGDIIENRMPCLLLRFPGAHEFRWNLMTADGPKAMAIEGPLECDDGAVLLEWALAGHGIVNRAWFEVARHVASGRLVEVAAGTPPAPVQMAVLLPDRRLQDTKIRLFADHMVAACKKILDSVDAQLPR